MTSSRIPVPRFPPAIAKMAAWIRPADDDARELPLLHRLAIVYLILPVIIWLVGWFEWWLGIPASILIVMAFLQAVSGTWTRKLRAATVAVIATAACWVMLTAAGGVFDAQNGDWLHQRTTFLDLGRYPWPTFLPDPLAEFTSVENDSSPLLRYYLGYYIMPALAAQWLGLASLNWAVPIWTWIGVALILLMFTREQRGWGIALAVGVFILFSGMDIMRVILWEGWNWIDLDIKRGGLLGLSVGRDHIEWDGFGQIRTQYSANTTILMWVPQHFIPAGLYALLMLQLRRHRRFLAVSGVLLAAGLFWSAFVPIGLLPLIGVLIWENGIRPFLRWPNLLIAAPLAALIALYLTSGATNFSSGWIWEAKRLVVRDPMGAVVLPVRVSPPGRPATNLTPRVASRTALHCVRRNPHPLAPVPVRPLQRPARTCLTPLPHLALLVLRGDHHAVLAYENVHTVEVLLRCRMHGRYPGHRLCHRIRRTRARSKK